MAPKRSRNSGKVRHQEELSRELRKRKITLFIQQVEKEAQERMNELESRLDNLMANIDRVFSVELMKFPLSIRKMRVGDSLTEELSASDVSLAVREQESPEMKRLTLKRVPSRRGKSVDPILVQPSLTRKSSRKMTAKGSKGEKKIRPSTDSLSAGNLGALASASNRRRWTKACDEAPPAKGKLRSVFSTGDLDCSVAGSSAHITVTTGRGQTMCFSEETKDKIDYNMLDDVALGQVQKLSKLIEYVSGRSRCHK
ncbi:borealin-2 isoform X2 [Syngnathoides biaculeatus]|uniref:borealin-2 isoform X2 n=1 Tax=Syngnathoides biaculeatus TaxID=300417 RepID=UPI002ADD94F5|nr:borealin-2 isoform X2 [Syngnathoides biaculeatus]